MNISGLKEFFSKPVALYGVSALDYYFHNFRRRQVPLIHLVYSGSLADLSKDIETLSFPGLEGVDAEGEIDGNLYQFIVLDDDKLTTIPKSLEPFNFVYIIDKQIYEDLGQAYTAIKSKTMLGPSGWFSQKPINPNQVWDAAIYAARYPLQPDQEQAIESQEKLSTGFWPPAHPAYLQRSLNLIITGRWAHRGIKLLHAFGAIEHYWPMLAIMDQTSHSKECHPEGNVWEHSLEALKHRKIFDLDLSLALFLHDCGKPRAQRNKHRLFDGHAELGAQIAKQLLVELEYPPKQIDQIYWLIESHMLPSGLKTLPNYRSEPYLSHQLFPKLLELYRCDLASTWRELGDYHHACAVYKGFQRYRKNPYRDSGGKIIHSLNQVLER